MSTSRRGRPRNAAARTRIISAANQLFVRDGYRQTTVGDIAERAGAAVQTIYSAFGSKLGVLSAAHDVALASDDDPVPLLERGWFAELPQADSPMAACEIAVANVTASTVRVAPIYAVVQSASADEDVAALLGELHEQRHSFSRSLARQLLAVPGASEAMVDEERFADILYATLCVETYTLYVTECGWSVEDWRDRARGTVVAAMGVASA